MNITTKLLLIAWSAILLIGSIDIGYRLLSLFTTAHTLINKIWLIGLFILLVLLVIFFLVAIIIDIKEVDNKK